MLLTILMLSMTKLMKTFIQRQNKSLMNNSQKELK